MMFIQIYACINNMLDHAFFRDYIDTGSVYITPDSGGESGVPYETYFPMPTPAKDKPWYSIEQASVHITVISTEHDWSQNSEQVKIIKHFCSALYLSNLAYGILSLFDVFRFVTLCNGYTIQYQWMRRDMASVDRSKTPWLIFMG